MSQGTLKILIYVDAHRWCAILCGRYLYISEMAFSCL